MKNKLTGLILLTSIFAISTLVSCKKKDEGVKTTLAVSPAGTFLNANPGEYKIFTIVGTTSASNLKRLKISYKRDQGPTQLLLDSVLSASKLSYGHTFQIPDYGPQNVYLSFYFELTDSDGETVTVAKGVTVNYPNHVLTEIVSNELYGPKSGLPYVYNIRAQTALAYSLPYTLNMNISDTTQLPDDSLSRSWISPAGGKFARNNSFVMPNPTITDLKNQFEMTAGTEKIYGLKIGDIILYKQFYGEELFYAMITITDIQNNPGNNNDKYVFNIKR